MIATSACPHITISNLVQAAQRGDQAAFGILCENHQAMVRSTVLAKVRHEANSDDVMQEVFVQAWQRIGELKCPASFSGWIRTIARNKALDFLKSKIRQREVGDLGGFSTVQNKSPGPAEVAMRIETHERLHRAITALPKPYRELVHLIYLEGRSLRQISEKTGLPIGTVKSRAHTARERLKPQFVERE